MNQLIEPLELRRLLDGASLDNGLLHVELTREVPEALKPRTIQISTGGKAQPQTIEHGAKAA